MREAKAAGRISGRRLSVAVMSLVFAWVLAFAFEGQVLYSLSELYDIEPHSMVFNAIIAHLAGLISCGFMVKSSANAKRTMLLTTVLCLAAGFVFFFAPGPWWMPVLVGASYAAGLWVAAWGYFFFRDTPRNQRIKTAAEGLIFSNIIMIGINMLTVHGSARAGLAACTAVLVISLPLQGKLEASGQKQPEQEAPEVSRPERAGTGAALWKPLAFLCFFIAVITVNSGLMYQVINPAFDHLDRLASWYWAVPYIVALFIMKSLPKRVSRAYVLFVAIAMIGFSFIAFMLTDRSAGSYLLVDTLMLGACGIFDLFWWSILGEMLDYTDNPARILGLGLSANVLGVLVGGFIGNSIITGGARSTSPVLLALGVVLVVLVLLPLLNAQLSALLKNHAYLTAMSGVSEQGRTLAIEDFIGSGGLTGREEEITGQLLKGKTYRQIGQALFLSENTVKTHVKNVYTKFKVKSRAELISLLLEREFSQGAPEDTRQNG